MKTDRRYYQMTKQQIATIVGSALVVVVIITVGVLTKKNGVINSEIFGTKQDVSGSSSTSLPINQGPKTFSPEVPKSAELSIPKVQAPAAQGSDKVIGTYEIRVNAGGFDPLSLTMKQGNFAQIKFTAIDGEYDIEIPYTGMYQSAKRGETKPIAFQATTAGTFVFQCRDYCPEKNKKGELIVLPE